MRCSYNSKEWLTKLKLWERYRNCSKQKCISDALDVKVIVKKNVLLNEVIIIIIKNRPGLKWLSIGINLVP